MLQNMRSFSLLLGFLLAILPLSAQDWVETAKDKSCSFYDIIAAYKLEYGPDLRQDTKTHKRLGRWAWFTGPRTYPTGQPIPSGALHRGWEEKRRLEVILNKRAGTTTPNWSLIGPSDIPANGGGVGRLNVVRIHPIDSSVIFVGAPNGGLWKSTNLGTGWTSLTDQLPNQGVTDICIVPAHPDTMYIATGDGFNRINFGGFFSAGTYATGIMKTTDGGANWMATGLNWDFYDGTQVHRVVAHPHIVETIFAASNKGLFKSTNGGTTWNIQGMGAVPITDIEFHP